MRPAYMRMPKLLEQPLPKRLLLPASFALAAAVAGYCTLYNSLAGRDEPIGVGLIWAAVNVLPWFLAFEAAKRAGSAAILAAAMMVALLASLGLHLLAYGWPDAIGFEIVRRIPALLLVLALLGVRRLSLVATPAPGGELPLLPCQIDWVAAAGNYVELHGGGRTVLHRATLSSVETKLAGHGFVQVHRSTLVRGDSIARVRSVDLLLKDGTSLKLGKRYRAAVELVRPFVPAE